MSDMTKYDMNIEKIAAILYKNEAFFFRAPKTEELITILKEMYNEEDAAIGAHMNVFPGGEDPEEIADRVNMKKEELIPVLDRMIAKGLVWRSGEEGTYKYCMFAIDPGLLTTIMAKGEDTEKTRKLAAAFEKYYYTGLGQEFRSIKVPIMRVVPIEEKLQAETVVLPYEKLSELVKDVSYFAVTHCACKMSKKLVDQPCAHGPETEHCLLFGDFAKFFVTTGYAREITQAETYDIIKRAQDAGLIHTTVNTSKDYMAICNCCSCCCIYLRTYLELQDTKGQPCTAASNFFSFVEQDVCDGCKDFAKPICIGKCPMSAISLKSGKAVINAGKCIGCGICGYTCPIKGAITLKRRVNGGEEPPEDVAALASSVIGGRANLVEK